VPKVVDHDERRREIANAVARIAVARGVEAISFREVASEAGISVALVQHYFGTKENLLIGTINVQSEAIGQRMLAELGDLEPDADPLRRIEAIATTFLPVDDRSTSEMRLYLAFAGAALTNDALRTTEAFRNEGVLRAAVAELLELAASQHRVRDDLIPDIEARAIISLVLGLSLAVLLDSTTADEAVGVLKAHLDALSRGRHG
jgi:AcrR family transcriptional regulator